MIDDTPEVRWSNAWWQWLLLGTVVPIFLIGVTIHGMMGDEAYLVGMQRYAETTFEVVHGFQARLLWIGYAGLALASYGYGYARNHPRWDAIYPLAVAFGLLAAAVCLTWAALQPMI